MSFGAVQAEGHSTSTWVGACCGRKLAMRERVGRASREQSRRQWCRQDIGGINAPIHLQTAVPMQVILHCHLDLSLLGGLRNIGGGVLLRCTTGSIWDFVSIEVLATSLRTDPDFRARKLCRHFRSTAAAAEMAPATGPARTRAVLGQRAVPH